jgi:hypothetical protein
VLYVGRLRLKAQLMYRARRTRIDSEDSLVKRQLLAVQRLVWLLRCGRRRPTPTRPTPNPAALIQKDDEVDEDRATHHNGLTYAWTLPSRILRIFSYPIGLIRSPCVDLREHCSGPVLYCTTPSYFYVEGLIHDFTVASCLLTFRLKAEFMNS